MAKILVVEDDKDIREMLSETLNLWGFENITAKNGKEALKIFGGEDISLVLTDMRMPVMDGLTMLKKVRQIDSTVPVIVITGYPSVNSAVESLSCGADYYLVKPINMTDLKVKIEKSFKKLYLVKSQEKLKHLNRILFWLIPAALIIGLIIGNLIF